MNYGSMKWKKLYMDNIHALSANMNFICRSFRNRKKGVASFSAGSISQWAQMSFIFTGGQCTYIVLSCKAGQSVKNNCQIVWKKAETGVVVCVFNCVLYHVRDMLVPFLIVGLHKYGIRKATCLSVTAVYKKTSPYILNLHIHDVFLKC